ncbi:MAG: hypothetical protein K5905_22795 [Roseibium sp.]|uniref:hypothetical protein n=1 Tax=Roseibium sp. TaxID=1936156 RepID=UPI002619F9D1|nr:hypothetical protein [Roseibium sp.]MCV0428295.1 hypothetical protein [Roseibium sp.]
MKLSADLEMLKRGLSEHLLPNGDLKVSASEVQLLDFVLDDCIDQAKHLEAFRVQRQPTMIDLSDPKITLFPIARRLEPVVIPIRTPDSDGAA